MPDKKTLNLLITMITILKAERGEKLADNVEQYNFQKVLEVWRGLVNQRPVGPIDTSYMVAEKEFLSAYHQVHRKGVESCLPTKDPQIYLYRGDLCHLKVDAVVNAANSQMLGCFIPNHPCLDNALHTFAGLELRQYCSQLMLEANAPETIGKVKVTPGFHLPARLIFHTVAPFISRGKPVSRIRRDLLEQCYLSCLNEARELGVRIIAFPALATGEFGYPKDQAAKLAVSTVQKWLAKTASPLQVIFSTYTVEDQFYYKLLLERKDDSRVADT